jgi:hypothetical protein
MRCRRNNDGVEGIVPEYKPWREDSRQGAADRNQKTEILL